MKSKTTSPSEPTNNSSDLIRVSIIIPVLNEEELIVTAIDNAWNCGADEVIVADGGSVDDTIRLIEKANCQFIQSLPGRGQQLNAGARVASGDVLLFLHVDNWAVENAMQQIRDAMSDQECIGGGFKQRIDSHRPIFRLIEIGNQLRATYQRLVYGDQGMFVRRKVFQSLGGFPEIPLMEDFKFSETLFKGKQKPTMLAGPLHVSARRWEKMGVLKQTLRNWQIAAAYRRGATPESLYQRYYHD